MQLTDRDTTGSVVAANVTIMALGSHGLSFYLSKLSTLYLTTLPLCFSQSYQCHPDPCSLPSPSIVHICASFRIHRFIQLTYLMPCFTYYCMYHTTPDLVPIRLVVDRPLWTSLMYIRRPLLRKLGLKPDLVQS